MSKTAEEILKKKVLRLENLAGMQFEVLEAMEEYAKLKISKLEKEKDEALRLLNNALKLIHSLPDLLHDSLGDHTAGNDYEITSLSSERYITHKWVGSGEPLKQWIKSEIDKALK